VEWTVLIPVKELECAKSRLRGAVRGVPHRDLVLALVLDTLDAALACPAVAAVLVVSSDETVAAAARERGAKAIPDRPDAGLNAALRHGATVAGGGPLVALAGDLPALRGDDLAAVLTAVTARGYVRDAAGTGTTLLATPAGTPLDPRFGVDSARIHAGSGAVELAAPDSVRCDVDTAADLATAARLGLGARTRALL
jgi:2-phospho-L-lactate/phosphoenolpyruvate guanylyltransferase